jgi:hypothetical protein
MFDFSTPVLATLFVLLFLACTILLASFITRKLRAFGVTALTGIVCGFISFMAGLALLQRLGLNGLMEPYGALYFLGALAAIWFFKFLYECVEYAFDH